MTTNREHFAQSTEAVATLAELGQEVADLRALVEPVVTPAGITGEFEGTFKKIKIENGIITNFELEA